MSVVQSQTIANGSRYYFFPSIMVNKFGDAVIGFTGSSSSEYAGAYFAARLANDPSGTMSAPTLLKAGQGPQNNIDSYGRNRWGDYSYTTLDPTRRRNVVDHPGIRRGFEYLGHLGGRDCLRRLQSERGA